MKKTYTYPKIEIIKINSEEPTAAFVTGNFNSNVIIKADTGTTNVINY